MIVELVQKYANRGILVDTNILLLFIVGNTNPSLVPRFKRTMQFRIEDYGLLIAFLQQFSQRVTTPAIMTEVSNLAGQLSEPARTRGFHWIRAELEVCEEQYEPTREVVQDDQFSAIGVTDCGILRLIRDRYLLLTDDFQLANRAQAAGSDAINFNHLRQFD